MNKILHYLNSKAPICMCHQKWQSKRLRWPHTLIEAISQMNTGKEDDASNLHPVWPFNFKLSSSINCNHWADHSCLPVYRLLQSMTLLKMQCFRAFSSQTLQFDISKCTALRKWPSYANKRQALTSAINLSTGSNIALAVPWCVTWCRQLFTSDIEGGRPIVLNCCCSI